MINELMIERGRKYKTLRILLLVSSIMLILGSTVLFRESKVQLPKAMSEILWSYKAWISGDGRLGKLILLNILLFVPFGFSLALLSKRNWLVVLSGFLFSAVIEVIQLKLGLGLFEYDDMISNTLGTLIGLLVVRGCQQMMKYQH